MRKKFSTLESRMKRKSTKGFLFLWKVFRSIFKTVIYVSPLIWKLSRWAHRAFTLPRTLSPLRALKGTTRNFNFEETLMKTKWKEKNVESIFQFAFHFDFFFPFRSSTHKKHETFSVSPFCYFSALLPLINQLVFMTIDEREREIQSSNGKECNTRPKSLVNIFIWIATQPRVLSNGFMMIVRRKHSLFDDDFRFIFTSRVFINRNINVEWRNWPLLRKVLRREKKL